MISKKLTPEFLIETYICNCFDNDYSGIYHRINHWDCQDTERNNETECYFYILESNRNLIPSIQNQLEEMLGVPCCQVEEPEMGHEDEIRLCYIVGVNEKYEKSIY